MKTITVNISEEHEHFLQTIVEQSKVSMDTAVELVLSQYISSIQDDDDGESDIRMLSTEQLRSVYRNLIGSSPDKDMNRESLIAKIEELAEEDDDWDEIEDLDKLSSEELSEICDKAGLDVPEDRKEMIRVIKEALE